MQSVETMVVNGIGRYRETSEYWTDEGCHITELHNSAADGGCSIARARVEPGVSTRLHCVSDTIERYVILAGEGEVAIDRQVPVPVGAMDVVHIPAGVAQQITNTGDSDLIFLCVCTPRFRSANYADLDG